jgi:serine protease Do
MNGLKVIMAAAVSAGLLAAQPQPPEPPVFKPKVARSNGDLYLRMSGTSFLGIGVAEIDSERAKALKLKEERGVEVARVEEDSPAAKAGIETGDVVLEYNGERVEGAEQFVRLVRETPVGRQAKILISRKGATQTLTATIGSRSVFSDLEKSMAKLRVQVPDLPRPLMMTQVRSLGVETEALGSQLAAYFGVKEGALVRSVLSGSAAEKAGIKAGDVIVKVGDRGVARPNDISAALRSAPAATVPVTLMRDRKEITLTVAVEVNSGNLWLRGVSWDFL